MYNITQHYLTNEIIKNVLKKVVFVDKVIKFYSSTIFSMVQKNLLFLFDKEELHIKYSKKICKCSHYYAY